MKLKIQLQTPNAKVPTYAHPADGCVDLYAATVDGKASIGQLLSHGSPVVCGTGLAIAVPEGYVLLIGSRSGHGFRWNVRLANGVGFVDSGYTGEILVRLAMDDEFCDPEKELFVRPGDRIAQACLVPAPRMEFEVVDELPTSARGDGGFGSTGGVSAEKLWAIYIPGPDDYHAAPSESMAKEMAAKHNRAMQAYASLNKPDWGQEMIVANVAEWPGTTEAHAGEVAEFDYSAWGLGNCEVST